MAEGADLYFSPPFFMISYKAPVRYTDLFGETNSLSRCRCEYRRGGPSCLTHQEVRCQDPDAERTDLNWELRRRLLVERLARSRIGQFRRWRRDEIENCFCYGPARHHWRRPREPLRERHRGAGRPSAFLSRLFRSR